MVAKGDVSPVTSRYDSNGRTLIGNATFTPLPGSCYAVRDIERRQLPPCIGST